MFISLKWKAVGFLSIVLVVITGVWTWQIIDKQLEVFDAELDQTRLVQSNLLKELVDDNFLKLSQFSELISNQQPVLNSVTNSKGNAETLKQSLEQSWLSFHINLGLDYLAIYDHEKKKFGEIYAPNMQVDDDFQNTIYRTLGSKSLQKEPANLIYCDHSCYLVILQPFISVDGGTGTIALAQNMAEIVRTFYDFSGAGLGVLISNQGASVAEPEHYLPAWDDYAWAISDFSRLYPILKTYTNFNSPDIPQGRNLFSVYKNHYLISSLKLNNFKQMGKPVRLVSVQDESLVYESVSSNIQRAFITGVAGWLIAEMILLILINRPMRKLVNITEALHHLPQQNFKQAIDRVSGNGSFFVDELSTLQSSTVYVASELNKLHQEINQKNISLKEQVHALTRSRAFLTRLFDNSQIFIVTMNFKYNIQSSNMKFESLYDEPPSSFIQLIQDVAESEDFLDKTKSLIRHEIDAFQHQFYLADRYHKNLIIIWTHTLVEDEQGNQVILSIGMDQTRQKKAENELRWLANHDGLTSIGNRRAFNLTFRELLEKEIPGALVFIDVNRFKQINDIFGHSAGDQVLIDIANKLLKLTRAIDNISRFAGDEFTVLMANIKQEDLPAVLDKLSTELNTSIQTDAGSVVHYSVSIGASVFPQQGNNAQNLIINADMAMYHAKKKGVGQWHIFDDNDERVSQIKQDHNLILSIKNALKTDGFNLLYQPILDIHKNRISHYEALIRMHNENGEQVSPAVFIPLAEKMGEIRNIDKWVLDNVLKSMKQRLQTGELINIAINISAPTLQASDFPELLFNIINKYQVDTSAIIIELTETAYIENFQQVLKNLKQITRKGVRVALDDFGVGFSSFTYLKMLPLSYVKLDGSYIRNLTKNPDDQVFVKSLSAMISAFGMKIIAEFVEDRETLDMIEQLGVTHGQGYFIGKPALFDTIHQNTAVLESV